MLTNPTASPSRQLRLKKQLPKELWPTFLGTKLDDSAYDELLDADTDVYSPEGFLVCRLRKRVLPAGDCERAFHELKKIKEQSKNRGLANGNIFMKKLRGKYVKKDGTVSRTAALIGRPDDVKHLGMSSVIGYMDRYPRMPFCRQTAFNAHHPDRFEKILPFLQRVSETYQRFDAERFEKQMIWVRKTNQDFIIRGTPFTTITVNQNWQTAVHTDEGDLKDGLSCITVLRAGDFNGGHLVFPHYRLAVKLDSTDLLLFDSHHMHGNTAIIGKPGEFTRVSCVLYYRKKMIDCLSAVEELQRAKTRQRGTKL